MRPRHHAAVLLAITALVTTAVTASASGPGAPPLATAASRRVAVEALHTQLLRTGMPLTNMPLCQFVIGATTQEPTPRGCDPATAQASASAPPADSDARITMTKTASIPTPAGYIAALPVSGLASAAVAHVHSYGAVGVSDVDGRAVWSRSDVSFVREISELRAYVVPFVRMGRDPLYPTTPLGDHPFAVADLTGDGVDDVAVAHFVQRLGAPPRTTVDLLDGTDGHTVWMGVYSGGVVELAVVGDTLVIAQETGEPSAVQGGVSGERSSLHGVHFVVTGGEPGPGAGHGQGYDQSDGKGKGGSGGGPTTLTVQEAWTYSTGVSAARWLTLEGSSGAVAAGWSAAPIEATSGNHGKVLLLDAKTGAQRWAVTTSMYPRLVRFDTGRGELDLLEQDGPFAAQGPSYRITAYSIAAGLPGTSTTVGSAVPLQLAVGDVTGDGTAEWVVSEVQLAPGVGACPDPGVCASTAGVQLGSRVAAYAPTTGAVVWEKSYPAQGGELTSHPMAYDLALSRVAGKPVVLASAFTPSAANEQLTAYAGADGAELWARRGVNLGFPLYLTPTSVDGHLAVLTATGRTGIYGASAAISVDTFNTDLVQAVHPYNVVTTWAVDDGAVLHRAALLGDIHGATALDVNGDVTHDLVIGTDSGAVLALDGTRLGADPRVLWRKVLPTQVHEVRTADVDHDGRAEVVVTSAHTVAVLDGRTGGVRWSVAVPDTFQWTTTVGDLDGDGDDDLVVPADTLSGYDGRTGARLWRYTPSGVGHYAFGTPALTDGLVAAQYVDGVGAKVDTAMLEASPTSHSENDVLLDARTGMVRWTHSQPSQNAAPSLWRSAVLARGVAGVPGLAAAFTWDATGSDGRSHPTVDVYDAATGAKATSATSANGVASTGTLAVGGFVEEISTGSSLGIGPSGAAVDNLNGMLPLTALPTVVGGQEFVAIASIGGRFDVIAPGGLGASKPVRAGYLNAPDNNGGLEVVDVDGDGDSELVGLSFNWDGLGTAQLVAGRFSFALSVQPRALNIIDLAPAG